jgi:ribosomal protein L10
MSRKIKEMVEGEMKSRYGALKEALVVNAIGLTGVEANNLRRELNKKKWEMHVVPNRLFRRASEGTALSPLAKKMTGPCAIVTGGPSAVEMAKEFLKIAEAFPKLELKIGLVEGLDDPMPVAELSKLKTRGEMIGDVIMLAVSPGRRLAGAVKAPGGKIAACIKTVIEKLEKGETIAKVA